MTELEQKIMSVLASARALTTSEIVWCCEHGANVVRALLNLREAGKVTRNEIGYWSRPDIGEVKP